jgi:outer membrane protein, heavy metal efflux system
VRASVRSLEEDAVFIDLVCRRSAARWWLRTLAISLLFPAFGLASPQATVVPPAPAGPEGAPPVEELVARALANAPSVSARRARLGAAQAALKAADAPPDPTVEFEFRDAGFPEITIGSDPMSMLGGTLKQTLLSKGRKTARVNAAQAEIDVRHAETDATACDLTAAVRTAYGQLYAIDRERAILRDAEEIARLLSETAMARYAAGGIDQAAVLRAQLERTRLSERGTDLDAERKVNVLALNRLVNQPPDTPIGEVRELPDPPPLAGPLAAMPEAAANAAPELAVRRADLAAAARKVEAAKAELQPTYTLGGSIFWQGSVNPFVAFTVGIEWPARKDRKQKPLIAASEQELAAARFDLEDSTAATRAEASRLVVEIRRAEEQVTRYRSGLLPQSSAALDASRASYLGGRGDFASVLDEFRRWTDVRVELARREAARFVARGQLDVLVNPSAHDTWEHAAPVSAKEPRS